MTPKELRRHIGRLSPRGRFAEALQRSGRSGGTRNIWYSTQKEHLLGWLAEYDGPGYYGRANGRRSAEFVYNHFQCAAGLLWLAEASGVPKFALVKANKAVLAAGMNSAAQAAALRRVLPWALVEALLRAQRPHARRAR